MRYRWIQVAVHLCKGELVAQQQKSVLLTGFCAEKGFRHIVGLVSNICILSTHCLTLFGIEMI